MDPVVLAFMIIGDGNFNVNRIRIYLNAFTVNEVHQICRALQTKLGIEAVVRHDRNNQYIVVGEEIDKTRNIVRPHIHKSIIYRIGCHLRISFLVVFFFLILNLNIYKKSENWSPLTLFIDIQCL